MQNRILENELEDLQFDILRMSALVEKAVYESTRALINDQVDLAKEVISEDDQIDRLYIEVQDKCLRLLALRQPLAVDLRAIQTDLQIATDLERMGDYAENIARSTLRLHGQRSMTKLIYLPQMAEMVREMVHDIITAYILADIEMARSSVILEKEIDNLYREYFDMLMDTIKKDACKSAMAVQLLFAGHWLERIADHATNIGESVLYMVTGERVSLND
ncbi:MAG: phosphate signaling complex protein PhoU [Peptococcaceae bacterium]|nr:phosphate signaling complex protein PhoU [Peptococcaceae bacterium]